VLALLTIIPPEMPINPPVLATLTGDTSLFREKAADRREKDDSKNTNTVLGIPDL
jgi:hypothetical protein